MEGYLEQGVWGLQVLKGTEDSMGLRGEAPFAFLGSGFGMPKFEEVINVDDF